MRLKVLVVEDDREIRGLLLSVLAVEGFEVRSAVSLSEAQALMQHDSPDLVILDLGLPDGDGADLLRRVRTGASPPVVIVSARHEEAEKVALLDAGADDYLVKPFGVGELLARIRVALRHRGTPLRATLTRHAVGNLNIDLDSRLVEVAGSPVHLTPTEFNLLARLVRSAGQVVTHRQLLVDVWGAEFTGHTHYLRIYMANLRAKLEAEPAEPRYLLTEPGVGYRLASE
jgi:two-component system, OmpR family, KDP operon response regulator KdpE